MRNWYNETVNVLSNSKIRDWFVETVYVLFHSKKRLFVETVNGLSRSETGLVTLLMSSLILRECFVEPVRVLSNF